MLREGPRLRAEAHDAGDWLHTAIYLALPGHRVLLFGGTAYDERLITVVAGRGGETVVVGDAIAGASLAIPVRVAANHRSGRSGARDLDRPRAARD